VVREVPRSEKALLTMEEALRRLPGPEGERAATLFEHGSLLVKVYAPRGDDPQQPHTRDEIYVVVSGTGTFFDGERRKQFGPGDLLFAPAQTEHRFEDFGEDLSVWVMYFGPEGGEAVA
jgi:mannose-6-phosphate isomerase-like protein (cupin superfamily)